MMRLLPKKCRRGGLWVSGCRESFSYRVEGGDVLTLLTKNHISRHSNQTHSPNQIHSRWSIENQKNLSKNFINSQLRDRKRDQITVCSRNFKIKKWSDLTFRLLRNFITFLGASFREFFPVRICSVYVKFSPYSSDKIFRAGRGHFLNAKISRIRAKIHKKWRK